MKKVTAIMFPLCGLLVMISVSLPAQAQVTSQRIIDGSVDWEEVPEASLDAEKRSNADFVAALSQEDPPADGTYTDFPGWFCSGSLVGESLLMTNNHCAGHFEYAIFNYESDQSPDQLEVFRCDTVVDGKTDGPPNDVALYRCDDGPIGTDDPGPPGERYGFANLATFDRVEAGDDVYVIHQNCLFPEDQTNGQDDDNDGIIDENNRTTPPFRNHGGAGVDFCTPFKKISRGGVDEVIEEGDHEQHIQHTADTLGGSSGSPIFSEETDRIVGIHKAGGPRPSSGGRGEAVYNRSTSGNQMLTFFRQPPITALVNLDIFIIVDLSGSFGDDLDEFKEQATDIVDFLNGLKDIGVSPRVGIARFEDYPISPFGSAAAGDDAYKRVLDLTDPGQDSDGDGTPDVVETIQGLSIKFGGDSPQSQLAALFQAATGLGQDVNDDGDFTDTADIPPGQQASFRVLSVKTFLLWTDASFHKPGDSDGTYPGPSEDETTDALLGTLPIFFPEQNGPNRSPGGTIGVAGISSGGGGTEGLKTMARNTGTVAPESGTDCDGDGTVDIPEGEPLVCSIGSGGEGIGEAIETTVESAIEQAGNTPVGLDVPVDFPTEGITLIFNEVTAGGNTSISTSTDPPFGSFPDLQFLDTLYQFSTTANFTGPVTIEINYDDSDLSQDEESNLKLFKVTQNGGATTEDITTNLDTATNTITGQTDGFSFFAVGLSSSATNVVTIPTLNQWGYYLLLLLLLSLMAWRLHHRSRIGAD